MVIFVIMAAQYAFLLSSDYITTDLYQCYGCVAAVFVATLIVYFLGSGISKLCVNKIHIGDKGISVLKVLMVLLVFAGIVAFRYLNLNAITANGLKDSSGYDAAVAMFSNDFSLITSLGVHSASYVYVYCLYLVMQFLGTVPCAVIVFQLIIQGLSIVFILFACKRLFNYTTGLVASAVLGFAPIYCDKINEANAGCFLGLCLIVGLLFVSFLRDITQSALKIIYSVLLGAFIAALVYMDAFLGAVLIAVFVSFAYELQRFKENTGCKEATADTDNTEDTESKQTGVGIIWVSYIVLILVGVIAFGLYSMLDRGFTTYGLIAAATDWWRVSYSAPLPEILCIDGSYSFYELIYGLILLGLALCSVLGFLKREKSVCVLGWLLMVVLGIAPLCVVGYLRDNSLVIIVYAILAGFGVSGLGYEKTLKEVDSDESEPIEEIEAVEEPDPTEEPEAVEEPDPVEDIPEKIKLIPNPLPIPERKKHVTIDFAKEVSDEEMFFDVEIKDDDDFDI